MGYMLPITRFAGGAIHDQMDFRFQPTKFESKLIVFTHVRALYVPGQHVGGESQ